MGSGGRFAIQGFTFFIRGPFAFDVTEFTVLGAVRRAVFGKMDFLVCEALASTHLL